MVEPCCAEKQIPALLSANRLAVFQTNGDVTFELLLKSIACLAGNKVELQIFCPEISVEVLRVLAWYIRRDWLKSLSIITATCQSEIILHDLADLNIAPSCYSNNRIVEGAIIAKGDFGVVALRGALLPDPAPGLRNYVASFGSEAAAETKALTASLTSFLHPRNLDKAKQEPEPDAKIKRDEPVESTSESN